MQCYRSAEKNQLVAALTQGASLLIVAAAGLGKSELARFVAAELMTSQVPVALIVPMTPKQTLLDCATQLGLSVHRDDGTLLTVFQLQAAIAAFVAEHPAYLLFDDAHRLPVSLRVWLAQLLDQGGRCLLFATHPPRKDIFLKLPRVELQPLAHTHIRTLMQDTARELGLSLTPAQIARLQERTGGNPMLARRVLDEERLGLDAPAPDHTEWIDGTPLLFAVLLIFSAIRFLGRGLHQVDLYVLGGFLAIALGLLRLLLASLPRKSNRLGK